MKKTTYVFYIKRLYPAFFIMLCLISVPCFSQTLSGASVEFVELSQTKTVNGSDQSLDATPAQATYDVEFKVAGENYYVDVDGDKIIIGARNGTVISAVTSITFNFSGGTFNSIIGASFNSGASTGTNTSGVSASFTATSVTISGIQNKDFAQGYGLGNMGTVVFDITTAGVANTAPVIGGTNAGQSVNDNSTIAPFSSITTTDVDGDNLSATITLDNNAKGILTGTGLIGSGPYTIASTTPADLQAKLRALSFNPTDNRTTTSETTTFTVVINDGTTTETNNTTTVLSSAVAPTVTSIVRQSPTTSPTSADALVWDVTFDGAVANVDVTDFTVTGTTGTIASVTNPSGNVYRVTTSGGDLAGLNATVTLGFAGGQNIADVGGKALANLTPTGTNNNTFVVDNTAPRISSIVRQSPTTSPTSADALVWDVTFDGAVANVDATDFTVTGTTGTIASVTNPSGNVYRVTASGGDLAGLNATVTLGFAGGQNIADAAGNVLANLTPTGTNNNTFVVDNTAPRISSIVRQSPTTSPTSADALVWDVTFDGAVANVDATDFTVTGTTGTIASVTNPSGNVYRVTASGGDLAGLNATVTLGFAGGQNIADAAGNVLANLTPTGTNNNTFVVDNTAPRISSIVRQSPTTSPTSADALVWDVTFDGAVANVDATDFTVTGTTGTIASVTNPSGNVYRVTTSGGDLAGLNATVTLGFAGGQNIADAAGNILANLTPTGTNNNTFVVDNTAPRISSIVRQSPTTSPTSADALVWDVTFDGAVANVDATDFTVTGTTGTIASVTNPSGNVYRVTASGGDLAGLNATVTLGFAGGQNIADAAGNVLANLTPTGTNNNTFVVDNTAPRISSIVRQSPTTSPTSADALVWDVTFDGAVANVDATDFTVTGTTGTIASVTNPSGNVYRVTASGGDLAGLNATVTLGFAGGQNIADAAGNVLANLTPTGTNNNTFVVDNTAPRISSIVRQSPTTSPTSADALVWDVTFDGAVANVDATDFTVTGTTGTIASVTNPSGNVYRVTASGGDLAGLNATVTLGFAGGQNIADAAGNALANLTPTGTNNNTFVVDNTAPTAPTVAVQTTNDLTPTVTGTNGLGTALPSGETMTITVNGATYNVVPDGSGNWSVEVGVDTPANGTLGNFINGVSYEVVAVVTDLAGNSSTDVNNNEVIIDTTAPTLVSTSPSDDATGVALGSNLTLTFSENVVKGTGNIVIYDALDDAVVATIAVTSDQVSITDKVVTINPTADLLKSKNYYVQVANTALKDASGNAFAGILDKTSFNFATELKATPTITFSNLSKTYGDAAFDLTATSTSSATVTYSVVTGGTGAVTLSGKNVTITKAGTVKIKASVAANANYEAAEKEITLTINKVALTVTADVQSKVYGGTEPILTYTITGFVNGDTEASLDTGVSISRVAGENAGTYVITPSGALDSNYSISFVSKDFTITKAALTVTADAQSKVYGATEPTLTYTITGFVNEDAESSLDTGVSISRVAGENAGTYTITPSGASGSNYNIAFVSKDFTITKAALTVTADAQSKVYGTSEPTLTYTITGFVNGDTEASLDTGVSISRAAGENAGTYVITPSGALDSNYSIVFGSKDFTITKATQTITFGALSHTQDVFDLTATSSSGLAVDYSSSNTAVATISGKTVTVLSGGVTNITAMQVGDANYHPATAVVQVLTVIRLGVDEDVLLSKTVQVYPNPATNFIRVDLGNVNKAHIKIYSITGKQLLEVQDYTSKAVLNIASLQSGMYLLKIESDTASTMKKFIKK